MVVLDLLQIPYDRKEDVRIQRAHKFLQNYCRGALLHKQL